MHDRARRNDTLHLSVGNDKRLIAAKLPDRRPLGSWNYDSGTGHTDWTSLVGEGHGRTSMFRPPPLPFSSDH